MTADPAPDAASGSRFRAALRSHLGGLSRTFWILFSGQLVNRVGAMVGAFLVLYLGARGLHAGQIGLVLAARGVGALASQPIGGLLADRVGRRFTLITGLVSSGLALGLLGYAHALPALVAAAALHGLVADLYRPAANALVADVVPAPLRPKAYGLVFWAVNLGYSVVAMLAGFLAEHGFGLLFAVDAGTCVAFAVIIALGIRRDPERPVRTGAGTSKVGYRTALRDPLLVGLVALTLCYAAVYLQSQVTVPLAIRDHGLPSSVFGLTAALNGVLIVVLQPVLTTWLTRFNRMRVLAASWVLVGAGMAATGLCRTGGEFAVAVVVWTLGEVGTAGFIAALVADLAPTAARARYQATFGWAWGAAQLAGPTLGTLVYGSAGPAVLWGGCLAVGLACAGGALLMVRPLARRAARDAAARDPEPVTA